MTKVQALDGVRRDLRPERVGGVSALILGQAHKPQNRRQFRINYEMVLLEILFLATDSRGSLVRQADDTAKWIKFRLADSPSTIELRQNVRSEEILFDSFDRSQYLLELHRIRVRDSPPG